MADGESRESQTEEPTEKKIGDAIERGDVPFAKEASLFASVSAMLIIGAFVAKGLIAALTALLRQLLDDAGGLSIRNGGDAVALLRLVGQDAATILIAPLAILAAAGVLSSVLQNPPRLVFDRIQPDFKRISFANGWHRLFGARGQVEFLRGVFKLTSVGAVLFAILQWQQNNLVNAMAVEPEAVPELILTIAMRLLSVVGVATVLLLAADLVSARINWRRDLRMSRQELKDEFKQNEGDLLSAPALNEAAAHLSGRAPEAAPLVNVPAIAQSAILSGFGVSIIGALQTGFGALDRFFAAVLARSGQARAQTSPSSAAYPAAQSPAPAANYRAAPPAAPAARAIARQQPAQPRKILERGWVKDRAYVLFVDGSVEVETMLGRRIFPSLQEAQEFIA